VRFRLIPSDDRFFVLFTEAAVNAADCARRLRDLVEDFGDVEAKHALVEECEARGDELTDEILKRLDATFVTPFDREDIHALAEELDDVVDDMLTVSHLLRLLSIESILPELKVQADLLVQMADQTVALQRGIRGAGGPPLEGHRPGHGSRPQHGRGHLEHRRVDHPQARLRGAS
jgi:uncharacterized protein Yka (UPF0111/DUF47 family)